MELELIDILSNLYIKYGNTEEVIKLSKVVDLLVLDKQRLSYENYIRSANIN